MTSKSEWLDNILTSEHLLSSSARLKGFWSHLRAHKCLAIVGLVPGLILLDLLYLGIIWPNWGPLVKGAIPESRFIREFKERQAELPPKKAIPVVWLPRESIGLNGQALKVFIMAEDSRFYEHHGIDLEALKLAFAYNWKKGALSLGGSTITQQTVKNMFLSFSRNPLRKFHEILLSLAMEQNLSKKRILTIYLNIAEFGPGIFGIEAAARHYFHTGAANLTRNQLVALAATLPSPRKNNPATHTRSFARRQTRIGRAVDRYVAFAETHAAANTGHPAAESPQPPLPAPEATTGTAGITPPPETPESSQGEEARARNDAAHLQEDLMQLKLDLLRDDDREEPPHEPAE